MRKRPAAAQRRAANGGIRLACTQERPRRFCWPPPRGIDAETSGAAQRRAANGGIHLTCTQERPRRFCWRLAAVG
ncbi:hypothetical protein LJK88_01840 [Paenibacillus sp. P26]|nr:hypothetical protein LJK88_01840 [Paenibacillus sp. P26]